MTAYETLSVAIGSLAIILSALALFLSGKASRSNKNMFKREHVIELHMVWVGVNDIDCGNLVGPDVVNAANALGLTSVIWLHGVIDKTIIYQSYWVAFRGLYDSLYNCNELVPGKKVTCKSLITPEIEKAYEEMKDWQNKSVKQSEI